MNKKATKKEEKEKIIPEEEVLLTSLRAASWDEFFGQKNVKNSLQIAIQAAKKRREALEK